MVDYVYGGLFLAFFGVFWRLLAILNDFFLKYVLRELVPDIVYRLYSSRVSLENVDIKHVQNDFFEPQFKTNVPHGNQGCASTINTKMLPQHVCLEHETAKIRWARANFRLKCLFWVPGTHWYQYKNRLRGRILNFLLFSLTFWAFFPGDF